MLPDLGKYAVTVLSAYAASVVLIAGLVALSLWQSRRMKRRLEALESGQPATADRRGAEGAANV